MPTPTATIRVQGRAYTLAPGDIIGRVSSAVCRLVDPRISEAHAMVSLRGRGLVLLALRGDLWVDEDRVDEIPLEEGLCIRLAEGVDLHVEAVTLPQKVLAVRFAGQGPVELSARQYSLVDQPSPELVPRHLPEALAHLTNTAEGWAITRAGEPARQLRAGQQWDLGAYTLEVVSLTLAQAAASTTQGGGGRYRPLTVVARHTTVHILREGRTPVFINGRPAQLLSELVAMGGGGPWRAVAQEIWPKQQDPNLLRRNFDRALARLREHLVQAGLREDLVRSDGKGFFELLLLSGDAVRDES